ncbi:MAG: hypothetical protein WBE76_00790 [Terracidiphilus sp.]
MNLNPWNRILSSSPKFGGAFLLPLIIALLATPRSSFAATPSNASLSGTYEFHMSEVKEVYWYRNVSCHYTNITYTYSGGGQSANTEIINGEATFDGKGHVSISASDIHHFNSAASDATVSITCPAKPGDQVITNNGHMVLDATTPGSLEGTYAVKADGSGTITLSDGDGGLDLNLSAFNSAGVSTTVLIINPDSSEAYGTGIAVLK